MAENIGKRVGRLISGSFNAIINAAEDAAPLIVLNESVVEIDDAMREVRNEMGREVVNKRNIEKQISAQQERHKELLDQIEVAVGEGRDDLAEAGINAQMNIEAQLPILKESLAESNESIKKYEGYIDALQGKKSDLQSKIKLVKEQEAVQDSPTGKAETAMSNIDAMMERVIGADPMPEAVRADDKDSLGELDSLARDKKIRDRLEAIKSKNGIHG